MALKKKNVFQEFLQDDYVPSADQLIVKYVAGKGNNLHLVETPSGSLFLASMPKKFRQTVWLKKNDCLVIHPISEGKKVLGEIVCVMGVKDVVGLIRRGEWLGPTGKNDKGGGGGGDATKEEDIEELKKKLIMFFDNNSSKDKTENGSDITFPTSDSEEEDTEEENSSSSSSDSTEEECDPVDKEDQKEEAPLKTGNHTTPIPTSASSKTVLDDDQDPSTFTTHPQFLTSGVVTVTNTVNDLTLDLENQLQSLDFDAEEEDSSLESSLTSQNNQMTHHQQMSCNDMQTKANTIRIQVNYPKEETKEFLSNNVSNHSNSNAPCPANT